MYMEEEFDDLTKEDEILAGCMNLIEEEHLGIAG